MFRRSEAIFREQRQYFKANKTSYTHSTATNVLIVSITYYDKANISLLHVIISRNDYNIFSNYEGWNFNSGNYLFTTDTK